jgi:hypothetical protein
VIIIIQTPRSPEASASLLRRQDILCQAFGPNPGQCSQDVARGVDRNRAIAKARKAGATLRAIADVVGISKDWVRQIVEGK